MSYINTIKAVILEPKKFFSKIGKEKGIKRAFFIYLGYLLISNIVDLFTNAENTIYSILAPEGIKISFFILVFIISVLIGLLITFIFVGMDYLFLRLLKGKGTFENTFNAQIFSFLPFYIVQILVSIPLSLMGKYLSEGQIGAMPTSLNPAIIFGMIIFSILIFGVIIYCFYWYIYSLSILNKISKLRAFVAVVVLPILLIIVISVLLVTFFGPFFIRQMFVGF